MKNLRLLNKKYFLVSLFFLSLGFNVQSQEPIDIWKTDEDKSNKEISIIENSSLLLPLKVEVIELGGDSVRCMNALIPLRTGLHNVRPMPMPMQHYSQSYVSNLKRHLE